MNPSGMSPPPSAAPPTDWPRRAFRDADRPVLGGVAAGLARHVGWSVLWIRVGFVALAAAGGFGLALYAALWIFLPADPGLRIEAPGLESASRTGRRPGPRGRLADAGPAIALGALALGVVLSVQSAWGIGVVLWPVVIGLVGLSLLWRQADEAQRSRWDDVSGRLDPVRAVFGAGGFAAYTRVVLGVVFVFGALGLVSWRGGQGSVVRDMAVAGLLGILGLALVIGPWVVRLVADLGTERAERVRNQERADMAAHLHDSVLQTLALVQKNAHDPAMVSRLARAQERDLRNWLFQDPEAEGTLASALRATAARIEDEYDVTVDVVVVGDVALSAELRPLTAAASEAVVNAAKHAACARIDVYAEVSERQVEVFVRDRGVGFDLDLMAADRQGVRGSIVDRMERHAGTARVRSAPGEGTEVRLSMPRQIVKENR